MQVMVPDVDAREGFYKMVSEAQLVKRAGTPEECAQAYIFVMKCQFITGEIIKLDGGRTLV
jgi:NAD(P)-dependent dehydrogenase (short-subunit alcohol dehydrogenase family)